MRAERSSNYDQASAGQPHGHAPSPAEPHDESSRSTMTNRSYFELLSKHMNPPPHGGNGHARSHEAASDGDGPRLVGGRYELGARIGRGRHGEVYEAVDCTSVTMGVSRRVAVQLIEDSVASPQVVDELTRIYGALRTGSHPNVVRILDFGRDRHALFVAMDLLEGVSLRTVLEDAAPEPLSFDEAGPVISGVGDALDYLHAKGLVYGELRAENVFVTFDYRVKLLDVAHVVAAPQPSDDSTASAAPKHDARDDVYALACLSYELLAGRHPFNANSLVEARRAGLAPRPIPGLQPARWAAIARGLAFLRSERTRSIREYLDALGLTGQERLRAGADGDAQSAGPAIGAPAPAPSAVRGAVPPAWSAVPPDDVAVPPTLRRPRASRAFSGPTAWPPPTEHYEVPNPGRGALRATVALAALAVLAAFAFVYRDALRGATTELMAAFGPPPSTPRVATPVDPGAPAELASQANPQDSSVAGAAPGDAPASAPQNNATAAPEPQASGAQPTGLQPGGQQAGTTPQPSGPQGAPAASAPVRSPAEQPPLAAAEGSRDGASNVAGDAPAARLPEFERSSVTVREGDGAAAIVIRRIGDASSPVTLTWWPSDQTAVADDDYADLGHRVERLAAGEDRRTILVPLIGDAAPERTESFYVYLGRANASRSELSVVSSVRVDIVDDD